MIEITPLFLLYAGIVLASVLASACAPEKDRKAAFLMSALLFVSWVMHLSSWTPYAVEKLLHIGYLDVWSAMNLVGGISVLILASWTWWGPLLFGLLFSACTNDALYWLGVIKWGAFSGTADFIFLTENAVFFVLGGPGLASLVCHHSSGLWRHVSGALAPAQNAAVRPRG